MTDFLRECMSDMGMIPIDKFNAQWCVRCQRQECTRSAANNHEFVKRAKNWKDTLFLKVKRADEDDPEFEGIRAKNFVPINPSISISSKSFISPNMKAEEEEPKEQTLAEPKEEPKEQTLAEPKKEPKALTIKTTLGGTVQNTPFQQGAMLDQPQSQEVPIGGTIIMDDE